jgi:hypothetical protein
MKTHHFFLVLFLVCLILAGCSPKADFDILGKWEYTMTTTDGNTYDTGAITFSGEPAKGTYLEINIYQVDYKGDYTVNGTSLKLTGGETWLGEVENANSISGTWSHNDGSNGTFTATRK